ncbi:hypothetical protein BKA70DRAFT_1406049 [Coprinopsis sp. MPI-PUGE-AT-0042]|nr:hypothetical protein BKA70DRAFT_1406049 [Coprinopsis sp. MPI-PUGE-AT-0042]
MTLMLVMPSDFPSSNASIELIILKRTKAAQSFGIRESDVSFLSRRETQDPQHKQHNTAEGIVDIQLDGMERIMDVDPDTAYQPGIASAPTINWKDGDDSLVTIAAIGGHSCSTMTEFSLRLGEDALDHSGVARLGFLPSGPANDDVSIAPSIDVPSNSPPHRPNDWSPYRFSSSPEESLSSSRTLSKPWKKRPSSSDRTQYLSKLHRSGVDMHHIIMPISCTVAELNKELNKRLLEPTQQVGPHRLYLAEGGQGCPFRLQIRLQERIPQSAFMFFAVGSTAVKQGNVKGPAELPTLHQPLPPGSIVQSYQRPDRSIPAPHPPPHRAVFAEQQARHPSLAFTRLRTLVNLNISDKRFAELPKVGFDIESLAMLDVSFNKSKTLPDELGKLIYLQKPLLVGNEVKRFPDTSSRLVQLDFLDCRRNSVNALTIMSMLPMIRAINADHNNAHAMELSVGPFLSRLDISYNDITRLSLFPGPVGHPPYSLTSLGLSYAKLSSLDDIALGTPTSLKILWLDHSAFRTIPDSLGELRWLETLSCSDNNLDQLPTSIGQLQKLETLDAHKNNLLELPFMVWNCASLHRINATSNRLGGWHDPPIIHNSIEDDDLLVPHLVKEGSASSPTSIGSLPPLVHSLEQLYLAENILTHESVHTLMVFKELRVFNLSLNEIQELPPNLFCKVIYLEELCFSGNKLVSIPTEDLHRMTRLTTLYLNGNKLLTLPQELGKVKELSILDVGSDSSKYNIHDWNLNKRLKHLNLSSNNRFRIKAKSARYSSSPDRTSRDLGALGYQTLSRFKAPTLLRVLGLMDVTVTTTGADATADIPEETELRHVRTSLSTVNRMAYGVADSLGRNGVLTKLDLVHEFPVRSGEPRRAIFAMFGRSRPSKGLLAGTSPNKLSKFLHDNFVEQFTAKLGQIEPSKGEGVPDALRRTPSGARTPKPGIVAPPSASVGFDPHLFQTGASVVVACFVDKVLYVANVGNALAVVSRKGVAHNLSRRHDPYDRDETAHVRLAEGWVLCSGLINDEVEVSGGFGYFNFIPAFNPRPDMAAWNLTERDEFVIIADRSRWDYVPYQIAVDIARTEKDPMIASQKLRDFAISYGADGSTAMIMVVMVSDLFPPFAPLEPMSLKQTKQDQPNVDRRMEVPAPTDISHSSLQISAILLTSGRTCGGYEVKMAGDAFMVSFPAALAAVWWALTVQVDLLECSWPLEILEYEDGREIRDMDGNLLARGLSVRMGIHVGAPFCERDPITNQMDCFGSMVTMLLESASDAVDGIRDVGLEGIHAGEVKLKGFDFSESLAAVYLKGLGKRHYFKPGAPPTDSTSHA